MYIAKRIISGDQYVYFEEDTRWCSDRSRAKVFPNAEMARKESDFTGLYDVVIEKV